MSNITAIMARIAHDWPDDERAVATIPGGDDIGAWSRLTNAYGVAARFRGYEKSGAASARILRGAAAAAAAREETCNAPVTVRAIETDAEPRARLYTRATYSGTPAGFHAAMNDAANPWPAEVPKFRRVLVTLVPIRPRPRGERRSLRILPSSLSAHPSLSIPALDAIRLQLTPMNSTPTSLCMERPSASSARFTRAERRTRR
jgi:hypothetical protein